MTLVLDKKRQQKTAKDRRDSEGRFLFIFMLLNFLLLCLVFIIKVLRTETTKKEEKENVKTPLSERKETKPKITKEEEVIQETKKPTKKPGEDSKVSSEENLSNWFTAIPELKSEDKDFIHWLKNQKSEDLENFSDPHWIAEKMKSSELDLVELRKEFEQQEKE